MVFWCHLQIYALTQSVCLSVCDVTTSCDVMHPYIPGGKYFYYLCSIIRNVTRNFLSIWFLFRETVLFLLAISFIHLVVLDHSSVELPGFIIFFLLFAISLHFISRYYSAKTSHLFFSCNIPQFLAHFYPFLTLLLVHCSFVRTLCFEAKFFLLLFASKT